MFLKEIKHSVSETFKLLWQFKWYVVVYLLFYIFLYVNYLIPSPKNYFLWYNWHDYDLRTYRETTKLLLIVFALVFFVGTSNMRNHPLLAKLIFLSSLFFVAVLLGN